MSLIQFVSNRSNEPVPFESGRIVQSILDAMAEAGSGDSSLAEELGLAVVHFLELGAQPASQRLDALQQPNEKQSSEVLAESESTSNRSEPKSEETGEPIRLDTIHDMVEKVLMETGHRVIARSYVLQRERRRRLREHRTPSFAQTAASQAQSLESDSRRRTPLGSHPSASVFDASVVTAGSDDSLRVEARLSGGVSNWSRDRIVAVLIEEADLDENEANEIAMAVEQRVLRRSPQSISTGLIRELVDAELFERGYSRSLERQASVSLPKYDLERLLFRGGDTKLSELVAGDPTQVAQLIGEMMLRQYVFDETLSAEIRSLLVDGSLHLHRTDCVMKLLRVPICADQLRPESYVNRRSISLTTAAHSNTMPSLFDKLFATCSLISGAVAEEIEIYRLGEALLSERQTLRELEHEDADCPKRSARQLAAALTSYLAARSGAQTAAPRLILRIPFTPSYVSINAHQGSLFDSAAGHTEEETAFFVVETLRQLLTQTQAVELLKECSLLFEVSEQSFLERRFGEALAAVLSTLPASIPVTFSVLEHRPQASALPGLIRRRTIDPLAQELAQSLLAGKLTLNLARIALDVVNTNSEGQLQKRLVEISKIIRQTLRSRAQFIGRLALHPDGPFSIIKNALPIDWSTSSLSATSPMTNSETGIPFKLNYALGIHGLDTAVRVLCGESMHESAQAERKGLELIETLAGALQASEQAGDPRIILEESANRGPLRRFEITDREHYAALLAKHPRADSYTSGARLPRWAPVDPLERWCLLEKFRPYLRLLNRLDDTARLRSEGYEVLIAFLEEICSQRGPRSTAMGALL